MLYEYKALLKLEIISCRSEVVIIMGILIDSLITTLLNPTDLLTDSKVIVGAEISWHLDPFPAFEQFHPASIVHLLEQPSPLTKLPSSHCR